MDETPHLSYTGTYDDTRQHGIAQAATRGEQHKGYRWKNSGSQAKRCSDRKHEARRTMGGGGNAMARVRSGSIVEVGTKEGGEGAVVYKLNMYTAVEWTSFLPPHLLSYFLRKATYAKRLSSAVSRTTQSTKQSPSVAYSHLLA